MVDTEAVASGRLHRRVHKHVRHHYFRVMPDNPHHRAVIWTVFWIMSGIILVQLMYPPTRAVPTALLDGETEAWQHEAKLAARITRLFDNTAFSLQLDNKSIDVPLNELGAAPETASMVGQLTNYPFWQRYVPLSVFMQPAQVDTATVTYTNAVTSAQCQRIAAELSYPPTNARLELTDGKLIATDERVGKKVEADKLCHTIQSSTVKLGDTTPIVVEATTIAPERVVADFTDVRLQAERALNREISFIHDNDVFRPTQDLVAGWLQLDAENNTTTLRLDNEHVKGYLESINKQIGQPAGTTDVRVVNGVEASRVNGESGERVDYDSALKAIQEQLFEDVVGEAIVLNLVDIAPTVVYNNRYTASEAGLRAYINDAADDYNARIMVRQLDGQAWEAGARQHESIPSASTYKVYVAMWLFDQMEQNKTNWNSPILDTNVSTCFDRMTIASTNACSQEWLNQAGRQAFNEYLYSRGVSRGTTFTSSVAVHTTAADLTNHMTKLERGELYGDTYRQRLYQSLSTHPYRYGIAAGSSGQVYDKVGFLWDYVHDTGVVKHPRGTYVLTIMTKGQSYARIASITREIERIMYP